MKKLVVTLFMGWMLLGLGAAHAASPAEEAFAKLKTLAGSWQLHSSEGDGVVTYTVRSDGSALEEEAMGMVTMYHLDGDTLLLTHYCSLGNQPRLRATEFKSPLASLEFVFVDVTNLKPGTGHISGVKFEFLDENHVKENWQFIKPDGSTGTEAFTLERIPQAAERK